VSDTRVPAIAGVLCFRSCGELVRARRFSFHRLLGGVDRAARLAPVSAK
jgi:hypothetical protein